MPAFNEPRTMGAPCWVDLTSGNLASAKSFYTALFGWEYEEMGEEFGNYNIITRNGEIVGGAMQYSAEFMGPVEINAWSIYFSTADIEASLQTAQAGGGQQTVPPMQVADQGTMAEALDSTGSMFGLWQPDTLQGFARWGEHGFPGWFELHTRDFDAATSFYTTLLGAEAGGAEMGEGMRYHTLDINGESQAGIWDITGVLPEDAPTTWNIYFIVDDTDAALEVAKQNGGSVLMEPEDTPYGRMSAIADPTGTVLNIISGGEM